MSLERIVHRSLLVLGCVVATLLVVACGGGASDEEELAEEIVDSLIGDLADEISEGLEGEGVDSDVDVEAELPDPVTVTMDKTGWWGGFAITVDEATAEARPGGAVDVSLAITFENRSPDSLEPPRAVLEGEGIAYETFETPPTVAGASVGSVTVAYTVHPGDVDIEATELSAVLEALTVAYGAADTNQTTIPLGQGEVETFEPVEFEIAGDAAHGDVVASFTTARLQASYEDGERDVYELIVADPTIIYDCDSDCDAVGFSVVRESFSVNGPSGETATVSGGSPFCCVGGHAGEPFNDGDMVFKITEPLEGTYALAVTPEDFGYGQQLGDVDPVPHTFDVMLSS